MWLKKTVYVLEPMENQHLVVDNSFSTRQLGKNGAIAAEMCRRAECVILGLFQVSDYDLKYES